MRKRQIIPLLAGGTLVAIGTVAWFNRDSIANDYIESALADRGVRASYRIDRIGVREQRLRDIVIGDPADPDLVARELDVTLGVGWTGPYVAAVRAREVQLKGRWTGERLTLGQIDKLLPEPDGEPFAFPAVLLDIDDALARIDTPWGRVGIEGVGRGDLSRNFAGTIAMSAPALTGGGCIAGGTSGQVALRIANGAPSVRGPVGIRTMRCASAGLALNDLSIGIGAGADKPLERMRARANLRGGSGSVAGITADGLTGAVNASGALSGLIDADWQLRARDMAQPLLSAQRVAVTGRGKRMASGALVADGRISLSGGRIGADPRRRLEALSGWGDSSPIGPIARKLGAALAAAGEEFALDSSYTVAGLTADTLTAAADDIRLVAGSGARIDLSGERAVRWNRATGLSFDGSADIGGGGLPDGRIRLVRAGSKGLLNGEARFEPYVADRAVVAMAPLAFRAAADGGARFATGLALSGPLGDGFVDRLSFPVAGAIGADGSVAIDGDCRPLRWQAIRAGGAALDSGAIRLCGAGSGPLLAWSGRGLSGGAILPAFVLNGRSGQSALRIASDGGSLTLADMAFALEGLTIEIGSGEEATRFDAASIGGGSDGRGFAGTLNGGSGKIGPTPFLLSGADGRWRMAGGTLTLETALNIDDAASDDRFQPMRGDSVSLSFADGIVRATGRLREATAGTAVADVMIDHRFASGTGSARFTVPTIAFAREGVQPVDLTRLALGVVASVEGAVSGSGEVRWTPDGVTSDGSFTTDRLDLAAAFGPVERLSGTIRFDDLIALTTRPGQEVRLGSVNPGIEVVDGVVRYQLLSGQRVRIEDGRWAFAGGNLLLQPALLDFAADRPRYLTFDVSNVDAALFLQRYEFDNLTATGMFDGVLPTVFDGNGGRVLGGSLVSRDGGGGLAYVGELSNRDLGTMANIAYGALKSLRYDNLVIRLNGNIDGEMLTEVDFRGLAQGEGAERNLLTQAISRLPFSFRIRINAPFRQLLTSARGLYDPTILIDQNLPALLRAEREAAAAARAKDTAVQVQESEDRP
jgi:translocation and assembly module TamB